MVGDGGAMGIGLFVVVMMVLLIFRLYVWYDGKWYGEEEEKRKRGQVAAGKLHVYVTFSDF